MQQGVRNITSINIDTRIEIKILEEIIAASPLLRNCKYDDNTENEINEPLSTLSIRSQNDSFFLYLFSRAIIKIVMDKDCKSERIDLDVYPGVIVRSSNLRKVVFHHSFH